MAVWLYSQKILAIQPDFYGYIATNSGLYSQDPYNLKIAYWTYMATTVPLKELCPQNFRHTYQVWCSVENKIHKWVNSN